MSPEAIEQYGRDRDAQARRRVIAGVATGRLASRTLRVPRDALLTSVAGAWVGSDPRTGPARRRAERQEPPSTTQPASTLRPRARQPGDCPTHSAASATPQPTTVGSPSASTSTRSTAAPSPCQENDALGGRHVCVQTLCRLPRSFATYHGTASVGPE
eukprot:4987805-Heterocapsa_arctica.AAC.1